MAHKQHFKPRFHEPETGFQEPDVATVGPEEVLADMSRIIEDPKSTPEDREDALGTASGAVVAMEPVVADSAAIHAEHVIGALALVALRIPGPIVWQAISDLMSKVFAGRRTFEEVRPQIERLIKP